MENSHKSMSQYKRVDAWYKTEIAIMNNLSTPPNEFARYVPVEVRDEFARSLARGTAMKVTRRHLLLWAAMAEINGVEEFDAPFGWSEEDVRTHILLEPS